jgi:hypothetical protein
MSAFRMPAEHGAWGILLVPYVSAALLAGPLQISTLLVLVAALAFFLLRGSLEAHGDWRVLHEPVHVSLAITGVLAAGWLMFAESRYALLPFAAAAGGLYLLQNTLARRHSREAQEKRSLAAELTGVVLLTLVAPATWIAARGQLDVQGVQIWLLNLLFFAGGVLYVKYRVRGLLVHRNFSGWSERIRFAWPVFTYHILLVAFLSAAVLRDSLPAMTILAFAPGVLRASRLLFQLGRRFPIRRLGWSEVVHAVAFAALLVLALKLSH